MISYLPEEAGAYKNLTGLGYLKFMADIYADNASQKKEYLEFAEEISDLKSRLKSKIATYSKGMTRKLLLARTVMSRPKLAILDEPTSGLDVMNAYEIRTVIKKLAKAGMAVLLSSHNMLEVEFLSDRLALINKGVIKASGTAKELKMQNQAENLEEVFMKIAL
jgi:ABC-2 type transport system ATP-binding protein